MLVFLALAAAADAPPAWWSSDGVAGESHLFARAQARDAKGFEAAQAALAKGRKAVADFDLGAAVVGGDTAAVGHVRRELAAQFLALQKHADLLANDYATVFGAAVQRALPTVGKGYTVKECTAPTSGISALLHRGGGGPSPCPGTSLDKAVAAAIDADPKLQASVTDILSVEWPTIALTPAPGKVVALTGSARSIDAATVARALRQEQIDAAQDDYDVAIEQLGDGLDSADPTVKAAAVQKGEAARAGWVKAVGTVGKGLWPELERKLRAAKLTDVGVCPVPADLGGCGVPDVTAQAKAAW